MRIGPIGAMIDVRDPDTSVPIAIDQMRAEHRTINGGRTIDRAPQILRAWDMTWQYCLESEYAALMGVLTGQLGSPVALLPGVDLPFNMLSPNQASAGDHLGTVDGFLDSAEGQDGTAAYVEGDSYQGIGHVEWTVDDGLLQLPGPVRKASLGTVQTQVFPANEGDVYTFSGQVESDGTRSASTLLVFVDNTGTVLLESSGNVVTATTWTLSTVTATAPVDTVAVGAYILAAAPSANGTVSLDALSLRHGTSTVWLPGLGSHYVSPEITDHGYTDIVQNGLSVSATLWEVA